MQKYNVAIMSEKEFIEITGDYPEFTNSYMENGFMVNSCDWLNLLEDYLKKPIVSIRPSGRDSWNEILIIFADGYIKDNKRYIAGDYDTCKETMVDIFLY